MTLWPSQHLMTMHCKPLEAGPCPSLFCSPRAFKHLLGPSPGRVLQVHWAPNRAATQRTSGCHKEPEGDNLPNLRNSREGFLGVAWVGLGWD